MQVARQGQSANLADLNVPISSLYQLTAPSTPEAARKTVAKKAKVAKVTHREIVETVAAAKPVTQKPRTQPVRMEPPTYQLEHAERDPEELPNFLLFVSRVEARASSLFEREPDEWQAATKHKADMPTELRDRLTDCLKALVDRAIVLIAEFEEVRAPQT